MNFINGFSGKHYGLLGEHLGHSFSPVIHSKLADYNYNLHEVKREKLGDWVSSSGLCGYNVTIPYKQEIMKYCHSLSSAARNIGAVNTVIRRPDGTLHGDNTDYYGFAYMLSKLSVDLKGGKALVLGNGGASKTIQVVLKEQGAEVIVFDVQGSGAKDYSELPLHTDAVLIVNATPVGMYPNTGASLVDLSKFPSLRGVCDLIYNPARTALLLQAEHLGIPCENGLSMLVAQAKRACELFTDSAISDEVIEDIRSQVALSTENIVLVGMPGCGKTTVGTILSDKLCRPLVDSDEEIKSRTGRAPSEIIREDGERAFRLIETQVLMDICKESGKVIATGGGAVTVPENRDLLRQNGVVVYIERDLSLLATDDRPLSSDLPQLFNKREPMYKAFSDVSVDGNTDAQLVAERIIKLFEENVI